MNKKNYWWPALLVILVALIGLCLGLWFNYYMTNKGIQVIREVEEKQHKERIEREKFIIDSLSSHTTKIDSIIEEKKYEEKKIDTIRVKEVEKITKLPLDSSVVFFKGKLKEYEKKFPNKNNP